MSTLLESGTVMSDAMLADHVAKVHHLTKRAGLSWINMEVLLQSVLASILSGAVYMFYSAKPPAVGVYIHQVTGIVLGVLLVARIVIGLSAVSEAVHKVQQFNKACRTLAVLSSYVGETLTISAGAEIEKKAVGKFRFELVRLLNLAVFTYQLMLKGLKMTVLPPSLQGETGSKMAEETHMLGTCGNPTIMVVKWLTNLIEQQRKAHRIGDSQVNGIMAKIDDLIDAYHSSLALTLAPGATTVISFGKIFVYIWVYTAAPVLALKELSDNPATDVDMDGLFLSLLYTFICALFYFGLYQAGSIMEKPVEAVTQLLPLDDLKFALSADLTDIVDDPDDQVPVFLVPPP